MLITVSMLLGMLPAAVSAEEVEEQPYLNVTFPAEMIVQDGDVQIQPLTETEETAAEVSSEETEEMSEIQDQDAELPLMQETGTEDSVELFAIPEEGVGGSCGENLTWFLSAEGTLTITGSGDMTDFPSSGGAPWFGYTFNYSEITKLELPEGLTRIGNFAFEGLQITQLTIPSTVQSLGMRAFAGCKSLEGDIVLPERLTTVGEYAFSRCEKIRSVHFGAATEDIDSTAFEYCNSLSAFTVSGGNRYFSAIDGVLLNQDGDSLVRFPNAYEGFEYIVPAQVTRIEQNAFYGSTIRHLTIHEDMEYIGDGAFYDSNITVLELLGCQEMGKNAFLYSSVSTVHIGSNVRMLGDGAFKFCEKMTTLTIDEGLSYMGKEAFAECDALKTVTIPGSLKRVGDFAFACYELSNVIVKEGVEELGDGCFKAEHLTDISLPSTLKVIGNGAFTGAYSLTHIELPEGLERIEESAFWGCSSLKYVVFPESLSYLGESAFAVCSDLDIAVFEGEVPETVGDDLFPSDIKVYYRFNKAYSGWTTPYWITEAGEQYMAYPILGDGDIDLDALNYYGDLGQRYIKFIQHRKTGQQPKVCGVTMTVGDVSITAPEDCDYITVLLAATGQEVTFTKEGMYPVTIPADLLCYFSTIEFYSIEETDPFVQAIYGRKVKGDLKGSWTDLLHDGMDLTAASTEEMMELYVDVNWNGHTESVIGLLQTGAQGQLQFLKNGYVDAANYSELLISGQPVYLSMRPLHEERFTEKLGIYVKPPVIDVQLDIADDMAIDSSEEMLKGFDMAIKLPGDMKLSFSMSEDGTVKGLLGVKDAGSKKKDETLYDMAKEAIIDPPADGDSYSLVERLVKNNGGTVDLPESAKLVFSADMQVLGYMEGRYEWVDGGYTLLFNEAAIAVKFSGEASHTYQWYTGTLPIYVKAAVKPSVQFQLPFRYDETIYDIKAQPVEVTISLPLRVGTGLGWDSILSAGVYGEGGATIKGAFPFDETDGYTSAKFGVEAAVFCLSSDVMLAQTDKEYFVGGPDALLLNLASSLTEVPESEWKIVPRDYLDAPELPELSLLAVDEENTLLDTGWVTEKPVYPYAAVQTAPLRNGDQIAVWLQDEQSRTITNRTRLYYSFYEADTRDWSDPKPVMAEDDGTADFNPVLHRVGNSVYLTWMNGSRELTHADKLDDLPGLMDLQFAYVENDGRMHSFRSFGTENYDTNACVGMVDYQPWVYWVSNEENTVFGGEEASYSIWRQCMRGNSEAECLASNLYHVDGMAADGNTVWFTADTDGDGSTLKDRELFCLSNGLASAYTDNDVADTKPVVVNGSLMWYSDGKLCSNGKEIELATDTDRFCYVASDSMEAVVYVSDDAVRKSTLYASFNDGSGWGAPMVLTSVTGNISSFSADLLTDGTLSIVTCERELDADSDNYLGTGAYLRHYTAMPQCDIAVTYVDYLEQSMSPNGQLILEVGVENRGMTNCRFLELNAGYNGVIAASKLMYADLASGEAATLYLNMPMPEDLTQMGEITVTSKADGQADGNNEDNSDSLVLRLADVSVEAVKAENDGEQTTVTALVANRGRTQLDGITVQLLDGDTLLTETVIENLATDNGTFVQLTLDKTWEDRKLLTVQTAVQDLPQTQENIAANNRQTVVVLSPEPSVYLVNGDAIATDTGATATVTFYNTTGETRTNSVCVAAYNKDGKLLDAAYETYVVDSTDKVVTLPLDGGDAVREVRIFVLDDKHVPIQEAEVITVRKTFVQ